MVAVYESDFALSGRVALDIVGQYPGIPAGQEPDFQLHERPEKAPAWRTLVNAFESRPQDTELHFPNDRDIVELTMEESGLFTAWRINARIDIRRDMKLERVSTLLRSNGGEDAGTYYGTRGILRTPIVVASDHTARATKRDYSKEIIHGPFASMDRLQYRRIGRAVTLEELRKRAS